VIIVMRRISVILLIIFSFTELQAQQQLTLKECRRLALEQSQEMKIARFRVEKADAERAAMKTQYLPSLSGNALGLYLHNPLSRSLRCPLRFPTRPPGSCGPM